MIIKLEENKIYLYGTIYRGDDIMFELYFSEIEANYTNVEVFIHTNGGDVFAGNYIQNRIKSSKINDEVICQGTAFSMGAYILLSGSKRKMARNGFIMIHAASDASGGTAKELRDAANVLEEINKNFSKDLIAVTGQSEQVVAEWLSKDTFFSAEQALEVGLIHEILDPFTEIDINATAENAYSQFTALLKPKKQIINPKIDTMKTPIITALGLTSVTAESSDTAVIGAVEAHYNARHTTLENKLTAEKEAHNALKQTVKDQNDAAITAYLEPLKKTHKEAQITAYRSIAENSGIATLKTVLGVSVRTPVAEFITPEGDATITAKEGWNWDKYQKEDPRALEAMQKDNPTAFSALYKVKFGKEFVA
jgi:ATP-dependent Clp endopeptidase proteolytic subunit ClpP